MGLLEGKRVLVTGVLVESSIAFHVARLAQQEGATVVLTSFGRQLRLTQAIARRLPSTPPVVELDVTNPEHLTGLSDAVRAHVDGLDAVLHSIAFAPQSAMGGNFLNTGWEDVATAVQVSAFSLKALGVAVLPLMSGGGSIVGLTFDASRAWPFYDWIESRAAFESTGRYLARDLGAEGAGESRRRWAVAHHGGQIDPGFKVFGDRWPSVLPSGGMWRTPNPPRGPAWR
jgi:enoyl-[acyl-carrier protein] reductase I